MSRVCYLQFHQRSWLALRLGHVQFSPEFRVRVDFPTLTLTKSPGSTPNIYPNPQSKFFIPDQNCEFPRKKEKKDQNHLSARRWQELPQIGGICKYRAFSSRGSKAFLCQYKATRFDWELKTNYYCIPCTLPCMYARSQSKVKECVRVRERERERAYRFNHTWYIRQRRHHITHTTIGHGVTDDYNHTHPLLLPQ